MSNLKYQIKFSKGGYKIFVQSDSHKSLYAHALVAERGKPVAYLIYRSSLREPRPAASHCSRRLFSTTDTTTGR